MYVQALLQQITTTTFTVNENVCRMCSLPNHWVHRQNASLNWARQAPVERLWGVRASG